MSKKHFIALADAIRNANSESSKRNVFNSEVIAHLAGFCESQNPRFKRDRWLNYIAGKCGKNGGTR